MMHVQLINESQYNKDHKLKIHSLCFYYRNHKHVLYGSFTINDEVFIFSFNIFDIYRSYHSKSNKKSSKTHKSSASNSAQNPSKSSSSNSKTTTSTLKTTTATTSTTTTIATSTIQPVVAQQQAQQTQPKIEMQTFKPSETSTVSVEQTTGANLIEAEGSEFQKYMNNIIKIDSDLVAKSDTPEAIQHQLSSENSTKNNSDDASDPKDKELSKQNSVNSINEKETPQTPTPTTITATTSTQSKPTKTESTSQKLTNLINANANAILNSNNVYYDNMFSLILNSENSKLGTNANSFDLFTLPKQPITLPKPIGSFQATLTSSSKPTPAAANLSNFLNVRFEITPNSQDASNTTPVSTSSKSKNKYKKTIKIQSVSCRPLSSLYTNEPCADIQLKSYEFTEKCLSFRLASVDLSAEPRTNFDIKLINLYEKYLCALVNFTHTITQQPSFKLFRIKHEETSSSTSSIAIAAASSNASSNASLASSTNSLNEVPKPTNASAEQAAFSPSCLAATSSSRLNLTEFILTSIPSSSLNSRVASIMPISVSTLEDDNDLKYIAILSENGTISIIDPNKCCKVIEFHPVSANDKFVQMVYCYGIDKICAKTESGKIYMISTRVYPIINQSLLDEISDTINLNEISLTKKLMVDAPLDNNVNLLLDLFCIFFNFDS